jgi:TfoX/Sxy family transcriptional regulator of competence genes
VAIPQLTPLQSAFHDVVTVWPEVAARPVFGHRGYVRAGKMFAFVVGDGMAVKASGAFADELYARPGVVAFAYNDMPMRQWPVLELRGDADLDDVLDQARRSYESVTR